MEEHMQNWKKALVFGSIGAGALLVITGRRPLGIACMAAGTAVLASEYPEKFEAVWENAPDYVNRATQIFAVLSRVSERFAEEVERRGVTAWNEIPGEHYARR
jgi:hypothetical protein